MSRSWAGACGTRIDYAAIRHEQAARREPCSPISAFANGSGRCADEFSVSRFPGRPRRLGVPGDDPSDQPGTKDRRPVSVVDVSPQDSRITRFAGRKSGTCCCCCFAVWPLLLFVAAFARPLFERSRSGGAATSGAREVVILVDRSYSMGYGNRWTTALDKAREVVGAIAANDRAPGSSSSRTSRRPPPDDNADRGRLENALKTAKLSSEATRYVAGDQDGGTSLAASNLPRKDIVLISDFQAGGVGQARRADVARPVSFSIPWTCRSGSPERCRRDRPDDRPRTRTPAANASWSRRE